MSAPVKLQQGRQSFFRTLYFRVLVGAVLGVIIGLLWPGFGQALKPFGDGFIKLVRMLIGPIIFLCVVVGVAGVGDLRKLGRIGLLALLYFEVVSTLALGMGLLAAQVAQPGRGLNVNAASLSTTGLSQYTSAAHQHGVVDFLLNIIPGSFVGAFSEGETLQILLLAILTGIALTMLGGDEPRLLGAFKSISEVFFKIVNIVMETAPLGALGAMAFTIGKYGIGTLLALGKMVLCAYVASLLFVVVVMGALCFLQGVNLWRLVVYLKEELLIVLATSSSEPALPGMLVKMENLGCSRMVTGLVIPAGYSFNLDGTSIYLTTAVLFIAQATNTHLTIGQKIFLLFVLMLNSKGAATVTGGGFITLASTLSVIHTLPVGGIGLLLGVDRFLSQARSLTNLIGNGVATIVIARWDGQFDSERARQVLAQPSAKVAVREVLEPVSVSSEEESGL